MAEKIAKVQVGARGYDIAMIDTESFQHELMRRGVSEPRAKSFIDYDDQIIVINNDLSADHKKELVIHELLHACLEDTGAKFNERIAEKFISAMSPRLNQLLSDGLLEMLSRLT